VVPFIQLKMERIDTSIPILMISIEKLGNNFYMKN
jgi:hypothetical protein